MSHIQRAAKECSATHVELDFGQTLDQHNKQTQRRTGQTQAQEALGYAFAVANYEFSKKTKNDERHRVEEVLLKGIGSDNLLNSPGFMSQTLLARNKNLSRELANSRYPESCTEHFLAESLALQETFPQSVTVGYCFGDKLKEIGLELLWAVGKGSTQPPGIINLTYTGDKDCQHIQHALVGKGIVFDCGGLHVKKFGYMEDMHSDKAGAAAVFGAFRAVVEMGLKINLTCTLALAENSISSTSYRPSDIYRSFAVSPLSHRDILSRSAILMLKADSC